MNAALSGALVALLLLACAAPVVVIKRREHLVSSSSAALQSLNELNREHSLNLQYLPSIDFQFTDRVTSKGRFDRYDLKTYFMSQIAAYEDYFSWELHARQANDDRYSVYFTLHDKLGRTRLGTSSSPRVAPERYARIEQKLFLKRRLAAPTSTAHIQCYVTYTSPQGRNSYQRGLE